MTVIEESQEIKIFLKAIEEKLNELVPLKKSPQQKLYEAARYSLLGGGKRLRPLLTLAAAHAFELPIEKALNAACALELVHTYSLIHDDLPCMDDDDLRRGKPSLHKAFDEAHAVLAGDYLLTRAFEVIAGDKNLTDKQKLRLTALLSKHSGGEGMIGGQILDLEAEGITLSYDDLCHVHHLKTGALISASVQFGGIIAEASDEVLEKLGVFGEKCGLAFQLTDDIIDVITPEEKLGKTAASDITNGKATSVSIIGIEKAKAHAAALLEEALLLLKTIPCQPDCLEKIAKRLVDREF